MPSDLATKCRTCMSEGNSHHQLQNYIVEDYRVLEMLDSVVPQIHAKAESSFANLICHLCVDKLLTGYKFQRLCIESDNHFRRLMGLSPLLDEDDLKPETIWDPLMEEERLALKLEQVDVEVNKDFEISPDKVEVILNYNNDLDGEGGEGCEKMDGGSDTDSSNEKLSVLKERKLKISLKISNHVKISRNSNITEEFPCTRLQRRTIRAKKQDILCDSSISAIKKPKRAYRKRKETEKDLESHKNGAIDEETNKEVIDSQSLGNDEIEIPFEETMDFNDNDEDYDDDDSVDFEKKTKGEKPNKNGRRHILPCEVCGKLFDRPSRLKRHSTVHSLDKPYSCEICKNRFSSETYMKAHKLKHISQICDSMTEFKCPHCPRVFEKHGSLRIHLQVHKQHYVSSSHPCQKCERIFMTTKSLIKHITNEHPESEQHACDQCEKTFVLHASLLEHQSKHNRNRKLMCAICDREYKFKSSLEKHMRSHSGERPYLCPECGKRFKCSSNLSEHLVRHTGLKIFQCSECPRRFKCRSDLKKHEPTHTNAKPYVCDICGTRFTRTHSLLHHKRLHTGERKFKCDKCSMSFSTKHHLVRHMRTHTGEKPYKCKFCDRGYAVGGDLTKHLRTHVGEKTYACDQCPMAFKYNSELRQHVSEHYKMEQKLQKEAQRTLDEIPEIAATTIIEKETPIATPTA